ncbi:hypothetical protein DFJ63DRAFT_101686 [Scheffersomyces coipomensis]|uniref:uncharacterized protein n=1 Tax=Scheffersomyces coipomensis TaxID=1788519 RepID=UPI00315CD1B9
MLNSMHIIVWEVSSKICLFYLTLRVLSLANQLILLDPMRIYLLAIIFVTFAAFIHGQETYDTKEISTQLHSNFDEPELCLAVIYNPKLFSLIFYYSNSCIRYDYDTIDEDEQVWTTRRGKVTLKPKAIFHAKLARLVDYFGYDHGE